MPGSKTTPGLAGARNDAPASFAFRGVNNVGTRVSNAFAAQWLTYTLPYRRFAVILAEDCARIGGDVGCYSFISVDSHHILLAGLPAHSLALRPAHSRGHPIVTAIRRLQPFRYLHDCSDCFRLERIAGWASHPLESAAFSRRTPKAAVRSKVARPRRVAAEGELPTRRAYIFGARRHASFERRVRDLTQAKPERQHSAVGCGSECRSRAKFQTSFHRVQQSNEGEASCR
jgi:hypothetical protein